MAARRKRRGTPAPPAAGRGAGSAGGTGASPSVRGGSGPGSARPVSGAVPPDSGTGAVPEARPPRPATKARPGRGASSARKTRRRRRSSAWARWRGRLAGGVRLFLKLPPALRTLIVLTVAAVLLAGANLVYQVAKKPTEMLVPMAGAFDKTPTETWREYASLFRAYSTAAVSPELLAALAQVEGAGNPLAHTYWRWRVTLDPLSVFRPASSAVGMYQMTDPAFSDARRYCIRHHRVVSDAACAFHDWYARLLPSHAIELTAISLDRGVAGVLKRVPKASAGPEQKRRLAALIHLCGAEPATAFAKRGFRLAAGETCGDHDAAAYLAKVEAMERRFARLAAAGD